MIHKPKKYEIETAQELNVIHEFDEPMEESEAETDWSFDSNEEDIEQSLGHFYY